MSTLSVTDIELAGSLEGAADETPPVFKDLAGSREIIQGCWAWCRFNGTGTAAIEDSFNIASITDNGTGSYSFAPTTNFPNATGAMAAVGSSGFSTTNNNRFITGVVTTVSNANVLCEDAGGVSSDVEYGQFVVFCNP